MYDTDEEQIEALKAWWNKNGNFIITAIIVFIVGYFGLNFYKNSIQNAKEAASDVYQELVEINTSGPELDAANKEKALNVIAMLKADHGDTTYALFGALQAAKLAVEADDLETAKTELQWAMDAKPEQGLEAVIRQRLARVTFALGDADAALALLDAPEPGAHVVGYEEIKGDILLSQGKTDDARAAYQKAMDAAKTNEFNRPVLEMKLDNLAVAN